VNREVQAAKENQEFIGTALGALYSGDFSFNLDAP